MCILKKLSFCFVLFVCLTSCEPINVTMDEFHSEMNKINDSTVYKSYNFEFGIITALINGKQFNNGIMEIPLKYKDGEPFILPVQTETSVRLILKNGRKFDFYFDTMFTKDTMVYGKVSHFFGTPIGIPYSRISKVQIQSP